MTASDTRRYVSIVNDDDDVPVIDHVTTLKVKTEASTNADNFSKSAAELKTYDGLGRGTKQRITTKLSKMRTGEGDAASTQITDPDYNGYQVFGVVEPPYNLDYLAQLYELNEAHHGAVDAKVANIVGLGYNFVESHASKMAIGKATTDKKRAKLQETLEQHRFDLQEQINKFNAEDSLTEVFIKVWRDYEATGNGYIEIGRKKDGSIGYIGHIASQTLRMRKDRDGFVQLSGQKAAFFANFGAGTDSDGNRKPVKDPVNGGTGPNEVIHIKRYSPTSGYYGIPDIVAAQKAVAGSEFAARYNLDYFENKAIPRYIITLKGAKLGQSAESSLLQFFETGLKGQSHRSMFIPLPPDSPSGAVEMKFEQIGPDSQDSSFNEYDKSNTNKILMVHRVPITKVSISDAASLAIAQDADKTFKEQVCAPEQAIFEAKVAKIIKELTDAFDLVFNEMTLTDESEQATIDDLYVKMGARLPNEIRTRQGQTGIPGGDERVDPNLKAKQQQTNADATRERDTTRQTNATDSTGTARNPKGEGRTTP